MSSTTEQEFKIYFIDNDIDKKLDMSISRVLNSKGIYLYFGTKSLINNKSLKKYLKDKYNITSLPLKVLIIEDNTKSIHKDNTWKPFSYKKNYYQFWLDKKGKDVNKFWGNIIMIFGKRRNGLTEDMITKPEDYDTVEM